MKLIDFKIERKSPNARHFFKYTYKGELRSGLQPEHIKKSNTVIRPDIDVRNDVKAINDGMASDPKDFNYKFEIMKLYFYGFLLSILLPMVLISFFIFALIISLSSFIFVLIILLFSLTLGIISYHQIPSMNQKIEQKITQLQYEKDRTEWFVNGRVYGEHKNEEGEDVLYPKRGDGFYALTPLEYLKLYTLQYHNGDREKSETLFQSLRKISSSNGTIPKNIKLSSKESEKIFSIYQECSKAKVCN